MGNEEKVEESEKKDERRRGRVRNKKEDKEKIKSKVLEEDLKVIGEDDNDLIEDKDFLKEDLDKGGDSSDPVEISIETKLGSFKGEVQRVNLEEEVFRENSDFKPSEEEKYRADRGGRNGFYSSSEGNRGEWVYGNVSGSEVYSETSKSNHYESGGRQAERTLYSGMKAKKVDSEGLRRAGESKLEVTGLREGFGVVDDDMRDNRDNKYD